MLAQIPARNSCILSAPSLSPFSFPPLAFHLSYHRWKGPLLFDDYVHCSTASFLPEKSLPWSFTPFRSGVFACALGKGDVPFLSGAGPSPLFGMPLGSGDFHHHPLKGGVLGPAHEILGHGSSFPAMLPRAAKKAASLRNTALLLIWIWLLQGYYYIVPTSYIM